MFKIKVGLKSFQTHSIQKSKHQIAQMWDYLKKSPTSSSMSCFMRKSHTTLTRRPHLNLSPVRRKLQSSLSPESSFIVETGPNLRSIFAKQVYLRDPTFYKEETRSVKMSPSDVLESSAFHFNEMRVFGAFNVFDNVKCKGKYKKQEGGRDHLVFLQKMNGFLNPKADHTKQVSKKEKFGSTKDFLGITPLPTFVKKMTTLRSPHIDKKSREQFEWKREKAQIYFHLNSVSQISLLLFIVTHSRFPGVEVEIGVESKTYFA